MSYSTNPLLPKARAAALRLLIAERLPLGVVADRYGIHRTTLWRWRKKWEQLNNYAGQERKNRPTRRTRFQPAYYKWRIVTESAAPHSHPHAIPEHIVRQVLALREELRRCAEVVWHHLTYVGDETGRKLTISLSSIKRIFRRHHVYDRATKRRRSYHRSLPRPYVAKPGELVQTDTIHLVDPLSMKRVYVYTVIDLYSRMAYARVYPRILPGFAAKTVLEAQKAFGFPFAMVQSDNGPEFSSHFEQRLHGKGIQTRHSRLHRPNDNAHIERFNRTIQEECTGQYWRRSVPLLRFQRQITDYLDYYNQKRVHLGLQCKIPAAVAVEMLQR